MSPACPGCGGRPGEPGHICHPSPHLAICPDCGMNALPGHLCPERLRQVRFVCTRCGRFSVEKTLLCNPLELLP